MGPPSSNLIAIAIISQSGRERISPIDAKNISKSLLNMKYFFTFLSM
jgi:hypothetical protein